MAMIFSTDEMFVNQRRTRRYNRPKYFVCFMKRRGKPSGMINISQGLMEKTTLSKKVILGYDKEANELVLMQSEKGNITITNSKRMSCTHASIGRFLEYAGFEAENFPVGIYKATVDEKGYIRVNLNCPLVNKGED